MAALTREGVIVALAAAAQALAPDLSAIAGAIDAADAGDDAELLALDERRRVALKRLHHMINNEPAWRRQERHAAWDRELEAAAAALDEVEALIAAAPAAGMAGLAVKLRVAERELLPADWGPQNTPTMALRAAIADANRLARHNQTIVGAEQAGL